MVNRNWLFKNIITSDFNKDFPSIERNKVIIDISMIFYRLKNDCNSLFNND